MFDTHIHLQRLESRFKLVGPVVVPAITPQEWQPLLQRFTTGGNVWLALGVHPQHGECWCESYRQQLEQSLSYPQVVAVGEVGLDAGLKLSAVDQEAVLRQQICLAVAAGKPLILHCHKRYGRLLELLQQESADKVGGIVHGFSGSIEMAYSLYALGFGVGIGRVILNDRARRLREAVTQLPEEMLVVETDAPWSQHYGEQDWTHVLAQVVAKIALLRGESVSNVEKYTDRNAYRLLKILSGSSE